MDLDEELYIERSSKKDGKYKYQKNTQQLLYMFFELIEYDFYDLILQGTKNKLVLQLKEIYS